MKLYLLHDPRHPATFAMFSHLGTWSDDEGLCAKCGQRVGQGLIEPLLIEWEPGTDRIGSFSWCGYTSVVLDEVRSFLEAEVPDCAFGQVKVVPPTGRSKRRRVTYPYTGPNLHWLRPRRYIPMNEQKSHVHLVSDCDLCRQRTVEFRREGLVIDRAAAEGAKMFHIEQYRRSRVIFVTEPFLEALQSAGFTNLCPLLAGHIE